MATKTRKYKEEKLDREDVGTAAREAASVNRTAGTASQSVGHGTDKTYSAVKGSPASYDVRTAVSAYVPSTAVSGARDYLTRIRDGGYDRKWSKALDALVDEYVNREEFKYDPSRDVAWRQTKAQGMKNARLVMDDVTARAAGLTGGYGNSYAATAGAAAYRGAVADLMAKGADYAEEAYDRYLEEEDGLRRRIELAKELDDAEYDRYTDELDRAADEYDSLFDRDYAMWRDAENDRRYALEAEYERLRDSVADERYEREWSYAVERDAAEDERLDESLAYERERDAIEDAWRAEQEAYERERDALADARDAEESAYERELDLMKLAEDARQFDAELSYDELRNAYDKLLSDTAEKEKEEREKAERAEHLESLKLNPKYKEAARKVSVAQNKEAAIRSLYNSSFFGNGKDAMDYLSLLCAANGLSLNNVIE